MIYFLTFAFLFMIGSLTGWIIELLFRRIFTAKRWINPGFLTGPCLPLYGFGLASLFLLARIPLDFIENDTLRKIVQILIMSIVVIFIEYLTGLIFIKGMKIKLWDYSKRWGNIQGIICPLFSLFWLIVCAVYTLLIDDKILQIANWFINNIYYSFFVGIFAGILIIDVIHSFDIANKIKAAAKENDIVVKWETLKSSIAEYGEKLKEKVNFISPFKSERSLKEIVQNYFEEHNKTKK